MDVEILCRFSMTRSLMGGEVGGMLDAAGQKRSPMGLVEPKARQSKVKL